MKRLLTMVVIAFGLSGLRAEVPGEFRPKPFLHPTEKVGATGQKMQPADTLPKSRAPLPPPPKRKQKLNVLTEPTQFGNSLIFNNGWEMVEGSRVSTNGAVLSVPGVDTRAWYDATVPGTILSTLVDQGVFRDPYFGLNNLTIPETLNKQDYWYRTTFTLPQGFAGRDLWLEFNGINYYAEIWFNGRYLGHITGAFARGRFKVTELAELQTENVLAVMIVPPPDPGIPSEQSVKYGPGDNGGAMCLDGPTFVCSEGWDWIPAIRDRDAGIWQDVWMRATGPVTIRDPHVVTALPTADLSRAEVTIDADVHNAATSPEKGILQGAFEDVQFEQPVTLQPGETKTVRFDPATFAQLKIQNPRLWWPNGYGKPELYHLTLSFMVSNNATGANSDGQTLSFGIRQMSYELEVKKPDGARQRMEFTPIAALGSTNPVIDVRRASLDWRQNGNEKEKETDVALWPGQENSASLRNLSDSAMGPYLVVKVNGQKILCLGGNWGMDDGMKRISREKLEPYIRMHRDANLTMIRNWSGQNTSEAFYQLCDEYGLLVWNDFWMDTEGWNYAPGNHQLFLANVADTITRFRNHPSIALWCAMNEGVPPDDINNGNDKLIRELDGTRYYQPNSRWVNLRTSGPWSNQPLENYFTNLNQGFSTEMGASSIPSAEVMRSMMAPADLWPPGDVWAYHDFHSKGAGNRNSVLDMIKRRYGQAQDLDDLCRKAQMVNYETYRAIYEGFDSRLWKSASGVLVWMSHPSWPSVVWQFYTWDYEPNASFFGVKKAAESLHIQMNLPDCRVSVVNHNPQGLSDLSASAAIYDLAGNSVDTVNATVSPAANAVTDAMPLNWPAQGAHLVRLQLHDKAGRLLAENFYWHARHEEDLQELNKLPPANLQVKFTANTNDAPTVLNAEISNIDKIPALAVRVILRDGQTGKRVLPAYYGDNFFSLLPGETKIVQIESRDALPEKIALGVDGWNVTSTTISQ
jgi:hypothetical protein